jgi:UDP-GlcNAc:undecaprenyl-phosphate GlcNAc-1-phosphate transferase
MALSIPLLDTAISVIRRLLKRQPIFSADRGHIHHKLLDRGLTPRRAVLVVYLGCSIVACFSLLQSSVRNNRLGGIITIVFCAMAWIGIQYLGYAEFSVAGKMLFSGDFQKTLRAQIELRQFERDIAAATSVENCWRVLCRTSERCGFQCERLVYGHGQSLDSRTAANPPESQARYLVQVPLPGGSHAEFSRPLNALVSAAVVGPFMEAVHWTFGPKLESLLSVERPGPATELDAAMAR